MSASLPTSRSPEAGDEDPVVLVQPFGGHLDVDLHLGPVRADHGHHERHLQEVVAAVGGVQGGPRDVGLVIAGRYHHDHPAADQLLDGVVPEQPQCRRRGGHDDARLVGGEQRLIRRGETRVGGRQGRLVRQRRAHVRAGKPRCCGRLPTALPGHLRAQPAAHLIDLRLVGGPRKRPSRASWIARPSSWSRVAKFATDATGISSTTSSAVTSGSTAPTINASRWSGSFGTGSCSLSRLIAALASACLSRMVSSRSRTCSRYSRSRAAACSCHAQCISNGARRNVTEHTPSPLVGRLSGSSARSGSSASPLTWPTSNHTAFPLPRRSTPHRSVSPSTSCMPRPVPAVSAYRRRTGRCVPPSWTSTRVPSGLDHTRTVTSLPACTNALVTISESARTAASTWASAPLRTIASCSRRRADPTLRASATRVTAVSTSW